MLTTPDRCPGHRWPDAKRIARMRPGETPRCIWCNLPGASKTDPRLGTGARWVA